MRNVNNIITYNIKKKSVKYLSCLEGEGEEELHSCQEVQVELQLLFLPLLKSSFHRLRCCFVDTIGQRFKK